MLGEFILGAVVGSALTEEEQIKKKTYLDDLKETLSHSSWKANNIIRNISDKKEMQEKYSIKADKYNELREKETKQKKKQKYFEKYIDAFNKSELAYDKKVSYEEKLKKELKRNKDMQVAFFLTAGYNYYTNGNIGLNDVKEFKKERGMK